MKDVDILKLHLHDLKRNTLITTDEEVELAKKAKNGDLEARNKLLTSNMRFVVNVAKKYQGRGLELEDLISEGYLGLIEAVEKFDPDRGYHFISYAVWWIRQSILKAIAEKKSPIRLPMNKINELTQIQNAKAQLKVLEKLNEDDELKEIANMLGMTKYHVREMLNISRDFLSLDGPLPGDDSGKLSLGDTIVSATSVDPYENALEINLKDSIKKALNTLDSKSAMILTMRYGLNGKKEMTLAECGKHFNLTKERVRQIEKKAIADLQRNSRRKILEDFVA